MKLFGDCWSGVDVQSAVTKQWRQTCLDVNCYHRLQALLSWWIISSWLLLLNQLLVPFNVIWLTTSTACSIDASRAGSLERTFADDTKTTAWKHWWDLKSTGADHRKSLAGPHPSWFSGWLLTEDHWCLYTGSPDIHRWLWTVSSDGTCQYVDCWVDVLQALREKCLQLEDNVQLLNNKLKEAYDVIAEKDCHIEVCNGFWWLVCFLFPSIAIWHCLVWVNIFYNF